MNNALTVRARGAWWEIRAAAGAPTAEVYIYGDIGKDWFGEGVDALEFAREIGAIEADYLTARINSYGGSVADGLAIYNALRRHPAAVTVAVDGVAVSSASLIAMAGDTVQMAENARLMIHAPWGVMVGNARDAEEYAAVLDGYAKSMAASYAAKSGQPLAAMEALLTDGKDHWYSAAEAKAAGFVDEITGALAIAAALPDRFRPAASRGARPKEPAMADLQPTPPAPAPNVVDLDAVRAAARTEALAAEQARGTEIRGLFARHKDRPGVVDLLDACLADLTCTPAAASAKLLAKLGEDAQPVNGPGAILAGLDVADKRVQAGTDALLARMGRGTVDSSNPYRGMNLGAMLRASLEAAGVPVSGKALDELAPLAGYRAGPFGQSTSDFPVILENTMHKLLQEGFTAQAMTWDRFCRVGDVSDFRAWKRLVPGMIGNLDTVTEEGEYQNKALPDAASNSITAVRRGNIVSVTPEVIINDDIGYIQTLLQGLGLAGNRAIERAVYALIVANPTMSDGNALWSAAHNNLQTTGAAPTAALLDAAASAMRLQTAPGSDAEPLDIRPYAVVAHSNFEGTLRTIVSAQYDPDTANKLQKPNVAFNIVREIVTSPRLGTAPWYLFADPAVNPVIEVVFLNGQRAPRLTQDENFRSGGLSWRVELPFGVGAIDWRGTYQNDGA